MTWLPVLHATSFLVLVVCAFMALPIGVAAFLGEQAVIPAFLIPMGVAAVIWLVMRLFTTRAQTATLSIRGSYLFVALAWVVSTVAGAVPLMLTGAVPRLPDALFEMMSGFTTTGASVLSDVEVLPQSILLWRSLTHWLGGMGIVVLTVALFPLLGIGSTRLVGAEAPGPSVDKVTAKLTDTAKILWAIYTVLTVAEILLLVAGGMPVLDATNHTFATMATGGFSPKNLSVGHYQSAYIDIVVTVFMIIAGANFVLYWRLVSGHTREVGRDTELKVYLGVTVVAIAVITVDLVLHAGMRTGQGIRYAAFQTASILTTTGFATADFARWPALSQVTLFVLMFIGGCAGSTAGGIKVVRITMLFRQAVAELRYLVVPRGVFAVRLNGRAIRKNAIYGVYAFMFLYLLCVFVCTLTVASAGYDLTTSVTASLATLGNIGPGLALVGPMTNYGHFPDYVKVVLTLAMMAGRLEIYTVLILLTPSFWRR